MDSIKINNKIELNKQFKISSMRAVIKPTKPHKHAGYFEVIFLTDGAGVHIIDDHDYSVEPPTLFFMSPGNIHCWEFSKIPKGVVCIFKEEFLSDNPTIKLKLLEFSTKYRLNATKIDFASDFKLLQEEYKMDQPDPTILKSYLNIILRKIARLPLQKSINQNNNNPLIVAFRKLVEIHFLDQRNLAYYADHLNISTRTLSNICKKEIGRSASSLINEKLVTESKQLLKHTSNNISQIAYHLNFNDPSHFVKFFKSKTNLTPKKFRTKIWQLSKMGNLY